MLIRGSILGLPVGTEKNQRNSSLVRLSIDRVSNFGHHQRATGDAKPKHRSSLVDPFTAHVLYFIDKMETSSLFRQVSTKVHGVTWKRITL